MKIQIFKIRYLILINLNLNLTWRLLLKFASSSPLPSVLPTDSNSRLPLNQDKMMDHQPQHHQQHQQLSQAGLHSLTQPPTSQAYNKMLKPNKFHLPSSIMVAIYSLLLSNFSTHSTLKPPLSHPSLSLRLFLKTWLLDNSTINLKDN